jgi:hypothetical protein
MVATANSVPLKWAIPMRKSGLRQREARVGITHCMPLKATDGNRRTGGAAPHRTTAVGT